MVHLETIEQFCVCNIDISFPTQTMKVTFVNFFGYFARKIWENIQTIFNPKNKKFQKDIFRL